MAIIEAYHSFSYVKNFIQHLATPNAEEIIREATGRSIILPELVKYLGKGGIEMR